MTDRLARRRDRRTLFAVVVGAMLLVAAGHLYAIQGATTLVAGLPAWLWLHLGVVAVLLAAAWLATGLATAGEV